MAKRPTAKAKKKPASKAAKPKAAKGKSKAVKAKPVRAKPGKPKALTPKKPAPRTLTVKVPQSVTVALPPVLHDRLHGLSQVMGLPVEGVIRQALTEFADTWEEHHRTVSSLAEPSDRVQLSVKD